MPWVPLCGISMSVGLAGSDQLVHVGSVRMYVPTHFYTEELFRETVQLMENFQDSTALVLVLIHM